MGLWSANIQAQATALTVRWATGERNPRQAIVSTNLDDDDEDGVPDASGQPVASALVDDDQVTVVIELDVRAPLRVETQGGMRVMDVAGSASNRAEFGPSLRHHVRLMGVIPSLRLDDSRVTFVSGSQSAVVDMTVVSVAMLNGANAPMWAHRDALGLAQRVTNDRTFPRANVFGVQSDDLRDVRVELWDPGADVAPTVRLESIVRHAAPPWTSGARRGLLTTLSMVRPASQLPFRTSFVRLVGDQTDLHAPGVEGRTLLVGLRDRVRAVYRRAGVAGVASTDLSVFRPGNEDGLAAARRARWRLFVLRGTVGGRPVVGGHDNVAVSILREQVRISNEIYLQCGISFGVAGHEPVQIVDPPRRTLLAVGEDDGLSALGGTIRLRVGGRSIAPVVSRAGWTPLETAEAIGRAIRATGMQVRVTANRRTDYGANPSADVQVRDARGVWLTFERDGDSALTTDVRQTVTLGEVDLRDGLDEFQNMNSACGTLEERTLMKTLMDDDPSTIELVVVNRFARGTRIGEAFVSGDGGALMNGLFLDRTGIAAQREAWTQSHEVGHILLDQPWHPDNLGPDRPWLLMDSDASLATVTGPKRLLPEDCARIRDESGVQSGVPILSRFDEVHVSPRAREFETYPGSVVMYPRGAVSEPPAAASESSRAESAHTIDAQSVGIRW
ncbi:MAG: hypothetical protein Q8Q09_28870 [Deltaproteobacteria bacterium]|nr:hypothetical protein [Deltaproteobacteria bacterium]